MKLRAEFPPEFASRLSDVRRPDGMPPERRGTCLEKHVLGPGPRRCGIRRDTISLRLAYTGRWRAASRGALALGPLAQYWQTPAVIIPVASHGKALVATRNNGPSNNQRQRGNPRRQQ